MDPFSYCSLCVCEYVCTFTSLFFRLSRRALKIKAISKEKKKQILYKNNIRSSFIFEGNYIIHKQMIFVCRFLLFYLRFFLLKFYFSQSIGYNYNHTVFPSHNLYTIIPYYNTKRKSLLFIQTSSFSSSIT